MMAASQPNSGQSPGYSFLLGLWRASHQALPCHPRGRPIAEAAMHALLVSLRRCPSAGALFARHFDRRDALADLILLASLIPMASPDTTWQEHAEVLLPIREAAFWVRWEELIGDA